MEISRILPAQLKLAARRAVVGLHCHHDTQTWIPIIAILQGTIQARSNGVVMPGSTSCAGGREKRILLRFSNVLSPSCAGRLIRTSELDMSTGIFGLLLQPPAPQPQHWYWQGSSGNWWITTIYPLVGSHVELSSVYVMVRRDPDGRRHPLYIGQTSDTSRRMDEHDRDKLRQAVLLGGNELHLHFLAQNERERFAVETDLRNGQNAPLNRQDSPAVFGGLFGLGAAYVEKPKQTLGGLLAGSR
ncbi:hypothetical protein [Rhizobium binae]|uniref:hypothetical protein n=1 Tax=Rhizobium binae TaxID=1138190 RepID=UPI001C82A825|nr:hypothetical protein [Rhizobium binae]MBX4967198.1 hypothetical protein [Rhizobium binae]